LFAVTPESIESLLPMLKLLANETRLRVIGLVADGEHSAVNLARRLAVTEATMSHHLSKLMAAELVTMRVEGTSHYYRLNTAALNAMNKSLLKPARLLRAPPSAMADTPSARILRSFIEDGRIRKLPEAHAKREVVLKWVLDQIEDKRYKEREISAILKRYFDDYATLRRELINHRLMKREAGVYWKAG
jgi:hypothetical protein